MSPPTLLQLRQYLVFVFYNHCLEIFFLDAPEVYVESSWVHAGEGQTAVLSCRVLANPAPKVG